MSQVEKDIFDEAFGEFVTETGITEDDRFCQKLSYQLYLNPNFCGHLQNKCVNPSPRIKSCLYLINLHKRFLTEALTNSKITEELVREVYTVYLELNDDWTAIFDYLFNMPQVCYLLNTSRNEKSENQIDRLLGF